MNALPLTIWRYEPGPSAAEVAMEGPHYILSYESDLPRHEQALGINIIRPGTPFNLPALEAAGIPYSDPHFYINGERDRYAPVGGPTNG